jgi:signal transduction histidine kinase
MAENENVSSAGRDRGMAAPRPASWAPAALAAVVRAPFTGRARRDFVFCLLGVVLGLPGPAAVVFLALLVVSPMLTKTYLSPPARLLVALALITLPVLVLVAGGGARGLGRAWRALAARLLGLRIAPPPPRAAARGARGRLAAGLRDGPGWRIVGYLLVKEPVALAECYVLFFWVAGLVNLTYPLWWLSFRNHAPGVRLSPVPVYTPLGYFGRGTFQVTDLAGTFAAAAVGLAMLLAAPWACRGVALADGWLMQRMLGPGLQQRVADLEGTRALAVEDAAATLRRLERDLHDGAQIRLATLAMNLGLARKKLGDDGDPLDVDATRELLGAAHQGAKDALVELRALALGMHPPVLDNGLPAALATLATGSSIPAGIAVTLRTRPSPAIETMAYFCAAELLANAAKHSQATEIAVEASDADGVLTLSVRDDGRGGADPERGSGLAGLAQRAHTVDGRLDIASPPGGPTQVTVTLPMRA